MTEVRDQRSEVSKSRRGGMSRKITGFALGAILLATRFAADTRHSDEESKNRNGETHGR